MSVFREGENMSDDASLLGLRRSKYIYFREMTDSLCPLDLAKVDIEKIRMAKEKFIRNTL